MPELPEVEHARARLSRWTKGKRIEEIRSLDDLVIPDRDAFEALRGLEVSRLDRRGKNVVVHFVGGAGPRALWFHLGMTGHLSQLPRSTALTETALPRFTRWALSTKDSVVALTDMRRMAKGFAGTEEQVAAHLSDLGPEATDVTPASLAEVLDTALVVKAALMDQSRIAGLGNIHAAEALFLAKVHPERPARSLTAEEIARLSSGIREALSRAMVPETEELAYVNEGGPNIFFVYGHEGEPCQVCGTTIVREVTRGRSTFLCPTCQPAGSDVKAATTKAPAKKAPAKKATKKAAKKAPTKQPVKKPAAR